MFHSSFLSACDESHLHGALSLEPCALSIERDRPWGPDGWCHDERLAVRLIDDRR